MNVVESSATVLESLERFLSEEQDHRGGPADAVAPGHRRVFVWPRHSVVAQYKIKPSQFTKKKRFEIHGEAFQVEIAETPFGFFAKCEELWAEAKGDSEEQMFVNLVQEVEPLFQRQFAISRVLGLQKRYDAPIADLKPSQLILLLYCEDRDVAHKAMYEIDAHASNGLYGAALVRVIEDESHPLRRQAQWCALDIFEDLPNVLGDIPEGKAIEAIRDLMMRATDDYTRAIYKAGDVLGDHVANDAATKVLVDVMLNGPQPFGRRSAIHGSIHLCEWLPEAKPRVLEALQQVAHNDSEPLLRSYAVATIQDIVSGVPHGPEPSLPGDLY